MFARVSKTVRLLSGKMVSMYTLLRPRAVGPSSIPPYGTIALPSEGWDLAKRRKGKQDLRSILLRLSSRVSIHLAPFLFIDYQLLNFQPHCISPSQTWTPYTPPSLLCQLVLILQALVHVSWKRAIWCLTPFKDSTFWRKKSTLFLAVSSTFKICDPFLNAEFCYSFSNFICTSMVGLALL